MIDAFSHFWAHVLHLGTRYGVNPAVFATLYLAHHPLFWGTMAWLAGRVRQHKPVGGVVALGVFFWIMPYAYVLIFGHGLPWWAYGAAAVILTVGGAHVTQEIRRRLAKTSVP